MRSAPQSRLLAAISLINVIVSVRVSACSSRHWICASRTHGRAHDASVEASLAGRGKALVPRSEPSWREPPGETGRSSDRRGV